MTALPPAGWYPDPEDATRSRYWDGATWTQRPPPAGPGSGLTIALGVCLTLLGVGVGPVAGLALLSGKPTDWSPQATEGADTIWRGYFAATLALGVVALVLGVRTLLRRSAHPAFSLVTGIVTMIIGLAGLLLGFAAVGNGDDMSTPLTLFGAGALITAGALAVTAFSVSVLVSRRARSRAGLPPAGTWPPAVAFGSDARPGDLGLRFLARLFDSVLIIVIAAVPEVLRAADVWQGNWYLSAFIPLAGGLAFVYFVVLEVSLGTTAGKKLLGLRVHGPAGAAKPTVRQSAIRNAVTLIAIIPTVGFLLVFAACIVIAVTIQSSPTAQGKHDELAGGTQVVEAHR